MRQTRILVPLLALLFLVPGGAQAHGDTYLHETFTNGWTEISPGLCAPGDTAGCVGPAEAQFRGGTDASSTCTLNGMFEGVMYSKAPCTFEVYGFMTGLAPGTKPACGAAFFYTSDATTAFGSGKVSTFTFDGITRRIDVEGYSLGIVLVFTKVEVDDDDADTDVDGDHFDIALPTPIMRDATGGSGASCVETPLTRGLMVSGTSVFV